uniref:Uncharacterized protein n=1 Tax=Chromera velia CCMP2878 TaxID=1169474 RepID=A0A0G4GIL1_9ALVE|eukprot:Cvel_4746.t1-p1 / transcript=Cvel_4746.t1 / gene=Cvel_4746 / organism=Chromera_velia_CCMP2878 / gene_product=hypothetical protein / transcript_product=hypothetical protein / location=Cvel_scaffold211:91312-91638(-) / protein_length=109 / sequence_SO=supercontig / SO=protein_coding / is_pseudo=false
MTSSNFRIAAGAEASFAVLSGESELAGWGHSVLLRREHFLTDSECSRVRRQPSFIEVSRERLDLRIVDVSVGQKHAVAVYETAGKGGSVTTGVAGFGGMVRGVSFRFLL